MSDQVPPNSGTPTDDEIVGMLDKARGAKRKKRNDRLPTPRLPEALYYYLFMLVETAVVLGVWGAMQGDPRDVLRAPPEGSPVSEWLVFNAKSAWDGLLYVLSSLWWVPLGIAAAATVVFIPRTPRDRKRMATWLSAVVVAVFFLMIAIKFMDDIARVSTYSG